MKTAAARFQFRLPHFPGKRAALLLAAVLVPLLALPGPVQAQAQVQAQSQSTPPAGTPQAQPGQPAGAAGAQAKPDAAKRAPPGARARGPAAAKWLVLAPLGLAPEEDKDGFNKTYGSTAASFANALQGVLKPGGIQGAIVIDQTPTSTHPTMDKIRQHLTSTQAGVLLVITMNGAQTADGRSMSLRLQYAEVEWQPREAKKENAPPSFRLTHPLVRDYPLWSDKQGNNPADFSSMAKDFLAYLGEEGRLK